MEITHTTKEVGPFRVLVNGRTVATAATRRMAERKAAERPGAVVQGRTVQVASFA